MLITFEGLTNTNQYLSPAVSHLLWSHPSIPDRLLLAEHDEKPYENYRTGQTKASGRSILGAIRLNGDNWQKDVWQCNFLVMAPQVMLFDQLVQAQQNTVSSVQLIDRWIDGVTTTKNVWLQTDAQYLTSVATNRWFRLQFQALEV